MPTSPECRSTATTTPGRSWSAPAPGRPRPGSRSARSPGGCCGRCWAPRSSATSWRSARSARPSDYVPGPQDQDRIDADPVRCLDPAASAAMQAEVDAAHRDGDTLGGVVEVVAYGLPPGLGSHVHWDRRLDGRLAGRADEHPGDQGRRGRRRLHHAPFGAARRRTTRSRAERRAASGGRPTGPAGSKAG